MGEKNKISATARLLAITALVLHLLLSALLLGMALNASIMDFITGILFIPGPGGIPKAASGLALIYAVLSAFCALSAWLLLKNKTAAFTLYASFASLMLLSTLLINLSVFNILIPVSGFAFIFVLRKSLKNMA